MSGYAGGLTGILLGMKNNPNADNGKKTGRSGRGGAGAHAAVAASTAPGPDPLPTQGPPTPPLTNRGCFTPGEGEVFHPDYLKLTIFADAQAVLEFVERALLERAGLPLGHWQNKGSFDRWENIFVGAGPVEILVPKQKRNIYTIVEIKGQGCASIGSKALWSFLSSLTVRGWRWHGLRVDLAFDHVAFTPQVIDEAIRAGNFNSRCLDIADRDWNDSGTGQTAYLGGRRSKKPRRLRVYNKNGYNRCEAEFRGDWAKGITHKLSETPLDQWPQVALGFLRGMVDFIDRQANERIDRCPLLPWWQSFVGSVERVRNLPNPDRRKEDSQSILVALRKAKHNLHQCSRRMWSLLKAFGPGEVVRAMIQIAELRLTDDDRNLAEQLAGWIRFCLPALPGHRPSLADIAKQVDADLERLAELDWPDDCPF